ncbi:MAG: aspartate carbamoyltransferase regulatory subunit [Thermoplasmata archaeon]|nr:aspartate carbamoyltransferase regulatory subunit [Thermoplasmata archaeon]
MKEFKVMPIKNGTVIDHITPGMALKVLKILDITGKSDSIVSVAMNVPSKKCTLKDIVKIEDRELAPEELNKIALIAPSATFNIIRKFNVGKKHTVALPDTIEGIVRCENPNCISNKSEPISPKCIVVSKMPVSLKCFYCDRDITDITSNII